jgi:hypothetical protein
MLETRKISWGYPALLRDVRFAASAAYLPISVLQQHSHSHGRANRSRRYGQGRQGGEGEADQVKRLLACLACLGAGLGGAGGGSKRRPLGVVPPGNRQLNRRVPVLPVPMCQPGEYPSKKCRAFPVCCSAQVLFWSSNQPASRLNHIEVGPCLSIVKSSTSYHTSASHCGFHIHIHPTTRLPLWSERES